MDTATRSSTTTPAGRARSSRRSSRFFAADVAAAYAAATGAAEDTQEEILWVAMEIGQHLADLGHAGAWHQIDGALLGRFTLTGDVDDRVCFLRLAAPMLVWLAETHQLDAARVHEILDGLGGAVKTCARSTRIVSRAIVRLGAAVLEQAAVPEEIEADVTIPIAVEESAPHASLQSDDVLIVAPASSVEERLQKEGLPPELVAAAELVAIESPRGRSAMLPTVHLRCLDAAPCSDCAADRPEDLPPEAA